MKKLFLTLLLLAGLAPAAEATKHYVHPDSNGVNNTFTFADPGGLDKVSPAPGDTVDFTHRGTYTVGWNPRLAGQDTARIIFIGDESDPDSVLLDFNWSSAGCNGAGCTSFRNDYVTIRGVTFDNGFYAGADPYGYHPQNDSLITVRLNSGLAFYGAENLRLVDVRSNSSGTSFNIEPGNAGNRWQSNSVGLDSCYITVSKSGSSSAKLLIWGDKDNDTEIDLRKTQVIAVTSSSAQQTPVTIYQLQDCEWSDSKIHLINNATPTETSIFTFREPSIGGLTAERCTLWVGGNTPTSYTPNNHGSYGKPRGWSWTDCWFINTSGDGTGPGRSYGYGIYFQGGPWDDTYTRCRFVADLDSIPEAVFMHGVGTGTSTFENCTFAALNGNPAYALEVNNNYWLGQLNLYSNIYYTGNVNGGLRSALRFSQMLNGLDLNVSHGLYAQYGGADNDVAWSYGTGAFSFYSAADFATALNLGASSVHGTPAWKDSTTTGFWTTLRSDSIAATSAAVGVGKNGTDIGPYQLATDTTRPDEVTDLIVYLINYNGAVLAWTATGDDSLTGTVAGYDIRYSTSAITAGNFASATPITWSGTPVTTGSVQTFAIYGSLPTPETVFWVALKAYDEAGNYSAISNVPVFRTRPKKQGGGLSEIDVAEVP